MQLTTSLLTILYATALASAIPQPNKEWPEKNHSGDYYSLGCPSTTKPWASRQEQLDAVTTYYTELFSGQVDTAFDTWTADNFINHSPEVKGDGKVFAKAAVSGLLSQSKEEILNIFVGKSQAGISYASVYFKGVNAKGVGAILEASPIYLEVFLMLISRKVLAICRRLFS